MRRTYKYRLYPTRSQSELLHGQINEACRLYNAALEERKLAWRMSGVRINFPSQCAQLKEIRAEGNLGISNAQVAQDVLHRVDDAFTGFFKRVKLGVKPGYPRFISRYRYDSITFPKYLNGVAIRDSGRLYIHGTGALKVKWHRAIPSNANIKTVTIKRQAGHWYACFSLIIDAEPLPYSKLEVGIDVGLTTFAVCSDGIEINNPKYFRTSERRIKIASRKLSRRMKRSNRRRKARQEFSQTHSHIANQRRDFHHKTSKVIVDKCGFIAVENLNIKGLSSGVLAKSVNNAGWGQFIRILSDKAEWAGRTFIKVNPNGTTQDCSSCGVKVPKTLKDRWHSCVCGLSISRDLNAAINILNRARMEPSGVNVGGAFGSEPCVA